MTRNKTSPARKKKSSSTGAKVRPAVAETDGGRPADANSRQKHSVGRVEAEASTTGVRLQKYLADRGVSSRRKIETLITEQKIRVDGRIAQLGDRVTPHSRISINGRPVRGHVTPQYARVILYNKPEGEISTRDDPDKRTTVFSKLPKIKGGRWIVIGRLDINTRGLLLFTNHGQLANQLMHPAFGLEREYLCRIFGKVTDDALNTLMDGVSLDGELVKFHQVKRQRGEGSNTWFNVIVGEGKYREVRRMWESVGCQVSRLMRIRYGSVTLPKNLKKGEWLELTSTEVSSLFQGGSGSSAEMGDQVIGADRKKSSVKKRQTKHITRLTPKGRKVRPGGNSERHVKSRSRRSD